jgi:hypothetical protein
MRWAVNENKVTRDNKRDVQDFVALLKRKDEMGLKKNGLKRFIRLQVRLEKAGVIRRLNDDSLRSLARGLYQGMPWWRKALLRVSFTFKQRRIEFHSWWASKLR